MATERIVVYVEGTPVEVSAHDTAASAALRAGLGHTRTSPITGEKRAPYCMMGVCFECLMVIDGAASRQACMVPVRPGMRIERQHGPRELD
ncbi:MAG: (2Fe-2S)-binding protein [Betaproteobacteria bacterium]|nr:MAG: (2Fe-2S)-binding protein [Betaproteobacteria bacterium]